MAEEETPAVPVVDLGRFLAAGDDERREIGRFVDGACRNTGFLAIENHGVDNGIVEAAWRVARQFFDLPLAEKLKTQPGTHGDPRGFFPVDFETLTRTRGVDAPPDPKESFSCGPPAPSGDGTVPAGLEFFYGPNRWPQSPADFQRAWTAYYGAMEGLGSKVMRLLAAALELPGDFFAAFHDHHVSALRALNYPESRGSLASGQQRAGAHSDYGSVTILKPDPVVGGLELQLPSGRWIAAPTIDTGFLVNLGDLMARWTNDRWVSTLHRVSPPPADGGGLVPRRQSIAYFQNPNHDALIRALPGCVPDGETPRHAPIQAGQYLVERFKSAI